MLIKKIVESKLDRLGGIINCFHKRMSNVHNFHYRYFRHLKIKTCPCIRQNFDYAGKYCVKNLGKHNYDFYCITQKAVGRGGTVDIKSNFEQFTRSSAQKVVKLAAATYLSFRFLFEFHIYYTCGNS